MAIRWKLKEKNLTNMQDSKYKKSFKLFLKNTNEKSVILKFIEEHIFLDKNKKFLDIGGGDGVLALTLAKNVDSIVIIEPNTYFVKKIKNNRNIEIINDKWENVKLEKKFDFILAAYVVTYFPQNKRKILIKKMFQKLNKDGKLLILSIDAKRGSGRKIHTYFYKLMDVKHKSSDEKLKRIINNYKAKRIIFKTKVRAKNTIEMLDILSFDFLKSPEAFKQHKHRLEQFLVKHKTKNGKISLNMVHNAYIITKK